MIAEILLGLGIVFLICILCFLGQLFGYAVIAARLAVDIVRPNFKSSSGYRWWKWSHNWCLIANFWSDFKMFLWKPLDTTDITVYGDANKFWWGGYGNWWYIKDGQTFYGKNYVVGE